MSQIGEQIRTQDNAATETPIFLVQQKRRIWDIDQLDSEWRWFNRYHEEVSEEEAAELNGDPDERGAALDWFYKRHYIDIWEFVTACFTEKGCEAYIAANGHNLKNPRIYVESGYRNQEWIAVRNFLISQAEAAQ